MKIPWWLIAARIGAIVVGLVSLLGGILLLATNSPADEMKFPGMVKEAYTGVAVGCIFLVPLKRMMKTRLAPFWLALVTGLTALIGWSVEKAWWKISGALVTSPLFWVTLATLVCLVGNVELVRRMWRESISNPGG